MIQLEAYDDDDMDMDVDMDIQYEVSFIEEDDNIIGFYFDVLPKEAVDIIRKEGIGVQFTQDIGYVVGVRAKEQYFSVYSPRSITMILYNIDEQEKHICACERVRRRSEFADYDAIAVGEYSLIDNSPSKVYGVIKCDNGVSEEGHQVLEKIASILIKVLHKNKPGDSTNPLDNYEDKFSNFTEVDVNVGDVILYDKQNPENPLVLDYPPIEV